MPAGLVFEAQTQRVDKFMLVSQTDTNGLLVAIPMVICLFAVLFRLDELLGAPRKPPEPGRRLTNWDRNGMPICTDPVRTVPTISRRKLRAGRGPDVGAGVAGVAESGMGQAAIRFGPARGAICGNPSKCVIKNG